MCTYFVLAKFLVQGIPNRAHADYFLVHKDERWNEKDDSLISPSKHYGDSFWNHGVVVLTAGASNEITDEEFEKEVKGSLIPSFNVVFEPSVLLWTATCQLWWWRMWYPQDCPLRVEVRTASKI